LGFTRRLLADRDLRVLLLANVLVGVAYSFVIPFLSLFGTREVGLGPVPFSLFMTANSLGAIALSTVLARWSDARWSRRSVLLLGSVAGCLGYLGYAYIRDVRLLSLVGVVVLGVASVTFSQLFALARDLFNKRGIAASEIPLYMNVFRLFFALSWTVGPAVAAWVMQWAGFRGLFLVASGFFALLALLVVGFMPHVPPSESARTAARSSWFGQALRVPGLLAHFAAFVVFFACSSMGMMNLPLLILRTLAGTEQQVGIAYSVAPVFELPFMFWFGLLASRGSPGRLIRIGVILAIAYYALLYFVREPWHIYPVQIISAAMIAVVSGIAITFFQSYIPDQPGTATNLYTTANRIGSTIGYLSFGTLAETIGYRAIFLVCAVVCGAAFLLLWLAREKHEEAAAV